MISREVDQEWRHRHRPVSWLEDARELAHRRRISTPMNFSQQLLEIKRRYRKAKSQGAQAHCAPHRRLYKRRRQAPRSTQPRSNQSKSSPRKQSSWFTIAPSPLLLHIELQAFRGEDGRSAVPQHSDPLPEKNPQTYPASHSHHRRADPSGI